MAKKEKLAHTQLPLFVERDEDGFYVVECPLFEGCFAQGKTLDEALQNIRELIQLVLEEKENLLKLASKIKKGELKITSSDYFDYSW